MRHIITARPASAPDARFLATIDYARDGQNSQAFLAERRQHWAGELPKGAVDQNVRVIRDNNSLYMGYVMLHRAFYEDDGPVVAYEMKLTERFNTEPIKAGVLKELGIMPQPDLSSIDLTDDRVLESA